ncbi:phytochelatin synthase family protein [Bythopirellula polymerisocia]|uniref:glutathione gamma-glutamylcysteinyltransferase n=1 Tax=Bythopirellula polymerisocia TaxID=2528003 RepID=A0A5C6D1Y7_9BACT|nr:phytochelatin synthase family protein [Bythopirellula polymerisocia]TWU29667.1 Phytochelatin synthase [Bythopirellula polymerisocia]
MPDDIPVYFDTEEGAALFQGSDIKGHFWTLCRYFISEKFLTYCGVASGVTVLNSLGVDAPDEPQIYPYKMFTQDNLFTDEVLHHRRPLDVEKGGNSLEQLASILCCFDVKVEVYFVDSIDEELCRHLLVESLKSPNQRVIVDFNRQTLHQKGNGHFSPLSAYHSGEDRFLLMDVARYKLPPCWVKSAMLYHAMTDVDASSGKSRGFLVVEQQIPEIRDVFESSSSIKR